MKRLLILLMIFTGCSADCRICTQEPNPLMDFSASVVVARVIDGDTYTIAYRSEEFSVRVLQFDAFEVRRGSRLDSQAVRAGITSDSALALGFLQKDKADSLLSKQTVVIRRDSTEDNFDNFGRLLRHTFINGKDFKELMEE